MNFSLDSSQLARAKAWSAEHDAAKHIPANGKRRKVGAIGGAYTYCFTPTGIGTVTKIQCSCGDNLDLTDYSLW